MKSLIEPPMHNAGQKLIEELTRKAESLARECAMLQPASEADCGVAAGLNEDDSEFHVITIDCAAVYVGGLGRRGIVSVYAEPPLLAGEYRPEAEFQAPQGRQSVRLTTTKVSTIPALFDLMAHIPVEWHPELSDTSETGRRLRSDYWEFHTNWNCRHGVHEGGFALVDAWDPYDASPRELAAVDTGLRVPALITFLQGGRSVGAVWMDECGTISGGIYMT